MCRIPANQGYNWFFCKFSSRFSVWLTCRIMSMTHLYANKLLLLCLNVILFKVGSTLLKHSTPKDRFSLFCWMKLWIILQCFKNISVIKCLKKASFQRYLQHYARTTTTWIIVPVGSLTSLLWSLAVKSFKVLTENLVSISLQQLALLPLLN